MLRGVEMNKTEQKKHKKTNMNALHTKTSNVIEKQEMFLSYKEKLEAVRADVDVKS